ncbi:MAG TPA: ImmA/IrrE family metallo-endopeptidase [Ktedonobacterales bacterium]
MIETQRIHYVQNYTSQLLKMANVQQPPVPVEQIARLRNVEVRCVAFDDALSGLLFEERGRTIIGVNQEHPKTRQRFTIAHELGHLELRHWREFHIDRHFPAIARGGRSEQAPNPEAEASAFAVELLLPAAMLAHDLGDHTLDYESEALLTLLARRYQVSLQILLFRLTSLGLVQAF